LIFWQFGSAKSTYIQQAQAERPQRSYLLILSPPLLSTTKGKFSLVIKYVANLNNNTFIDQNDCQLTLTLMINNLQKHKQILLQLSKLSLSIVTAGLILISCGKNDGIDPSDDPSSMAITSLEPSIGQAGQEVIIKGRNFGTKRSYINVFFGEDRAMVLSVADDQLKVVVPQNAVTSKVRVSLDTLRAYSKNNFTVDNSNAILWNAATRSGAASFVINGKAYVGTGRQSASTLLKDFWEYDPAANSWKRLGDFPSIARGSAYSFMIDNVGYVGGGDAAGNSHNMFAYDVATDTWTPKTPYPNSADLIQVKATTLGGKAYVGFGGTNFDGSKSFYVYDSATDQWTYKSTGYTGPSRSGGISFTLNNKIYIGLGADDNMRTLKDFYSFDPATDTWTKLGDFPGEGKYMAVGFALGNKGYVGTGMELVSGAVRVNNDMWSYESSTDKWTKVSNYGGSPRFGMTALIFGDKAYIGSGQDDYYNGYKDFWVFKP
jgi:N-acetylneuraminic acid mutarotase